MKHPDETFDNAVDPERFTPGSWLALGRELANARAKSAYTLLDVAYMVCPERTDRTGVEAKSADLSALEGGRVATLGEDNPHLALKPAAAYALALSAAEALGWDKGAVLNHLNDTSEPDETEPVDTNNPDSFVPQVWTYMGRELRHRREELGLSQYDLIQQATDAATPDAKRSAAARLSALEKGHVLTDWTTADPSHCQQLMLEPTKAYGLAVQVGAFLWFPGKVASHMARFSQSAKSREAKVVVDVVPGMDPFEALEPRATSPDVDSRTQSYIDGLNERQTEDGVVPGTAWITEQQALQDAEDLKAAEEARVRKALQDRLNELSGHYLAALDALKGLTTDRNQGRITSAVTVTSQAFTDAVQAIAYPTEPKDRAHVGTEAWIVSATDQGWVARNPAASDGFDRVSINLPNQRGASE